MVHLTPHHPRQPEPPFEPLLTGVLFRRQSSASGSSQPGSSTASAVSASSSGTGSGTATQSSGPTPPPSGGNESSTQTTESVTDEVTSNNSTSSISSTVDASTSTLEPEPLPPDDSELENAVAPVPNTEQDTEAIATSLSSTTTFEIPEKPTGSLIPEAAPKKVNQNAIIAGCAVALVLVIVGLFALRAVRRKKSLRGFQTMDPEVESRSSGDFIMQLPRTGITPPVAAINHYPALSEPRTNLEAIEERTEPQDLLPRPVEIYDPRQWAQWSLEQQPQEHSLLRQSSQRQQYQGKETQVQETEDVDPYYELANDPFADFVAVDHNETNFAYQAAAEAVWEESAKTDVTNAKAKRQRGNGLKRGNPNADVRFSNVYQEGNNGLVRVPTILRPLDSRAETKRFSVQSDSARSTNSLGVKAPVSLNLILPTPTQSIYIPEPRIR